MIATIKAVATKMRTGDLADLLHIPCIRQGQIPRQDQPLPGGQQPAMRQVRAVARKIGNRSARSEIRVLSRYRRAAGSIRDRYNLPRSPAPEDIPSRMIDPPVSPVIASSAVSERREIDRLPSIDERLVIGPGRDRMTLVGVADGDRVDDHLSLAKPIQPAAPMIGEVFAVGEDHDRLSLCVLLLTDGLESRVQSGSEVRTARPDRARAESMQRIDHMAEVFRQGATKDSSSGEGHDGRSILRLPSECVDQLLGRLHRHAEPGGHRILSPHAPADVDEQDRIVAGRMGSTPATPPRLCDRQHQEGGRKEVPEGPIARRASALCQRRPARRRLSRPQIAQRIRTGSIVSNQSLSG